MPGSRRAEEEGDRDQRAELPDRPDRGGGAAEGGVQLARVAEDRHQGAEGRGAEGDRR